MFLIFVTTTTIKHLLSLFASTVITLVTPQEIRCFLKNNKMRTVKLNTGVIVEFDEYDNMISVNSPYVKTTPVKTTVLRWLVKQIKNIIK